jgi:hypothetical protein
MAAIARDCPLQTPPNCGCAAASEGNTWLNLFDANDDCMVSIAEIQGNALVQSLLAPDVMIDGQNALSLGMRVTAVRAAFAP